MEILMYLMKANLCLIAFYGFYWVLLRKNTFFSANRFYLILSLIASFLLPLLKIKHNFDFEKPLPFTLNELPLENTKSIIYQPFISNISWFDVVTLLYLTGAVLFLLRLLYSMRKIYLLLINGDPIGEDETRTGRNYWLLKSTDTNSSYSFFNFLILNREDFYYNRNLITDHEEVHIAQWHSFDVLLLEVVQLFCWFNPVLIFYKESLRKLHEFIADSIVEGDEKVAYAEFLFAYNFRTSASSLGNNFFEGSLLKERISMMMQERSTILSAGKYLLIVPILLLLSYFVVVKDIRRGDVTNDNSKTINQF